MAARLFSITFGAKDIIALAQFWAEGLGWQVIVEDRRETVVAPTQGAGIPLVFMPVPGPKSAKNRIHLDLFTLSDEHQSQTVNRLLALGASHVDIGQGEVPWVVLADPEGNELCVEPPNLGYAETGPVAAIAFDAADPWSLGRFWSAALGWPTLHGTDHVAVLRGQAQNGPFLTLGPPVAAGKDRVHFHLAVSSEDEQRKEVQRLVNLGASPADSVHGNIGSVGLTDPEGNVLCVLPPRHSGLGGLLHG